MSDQKIVDILRAYGCPCGKTYLSYPALFTHVKQKHQGQAPGKLTKPTTGKIRGRPKTRIHSRGVKKQDDVEINQIITRIQHQLPQLIEDQFINYQIKFQKSEGNITCQDVATIFYNNFQKIGLNGIKILNCFFNQLRSAVNDKFGIQYWQTEKPSQIIQMANQLYLQHQQKQNIFPIDKQIFKGLIYNYFQWLYANKHTNHRLLKRGESQERTKISQ